MENQMLIRFIVLFVALILSITAYAGDQFCSGEISTVAINRDGRLGVALKDNKMPFVYICNLKSQFEDISTDSCKAMHANLLAGYMGNKEMHITFSPHHAKPCHEFSHWKYISNVNWVYFK